VLARPRRMQTRTLQSGRENTNEGFCNIEKKNDVY